MTTKNSKALVVLSGGQDSTTSLFWARKHFEDVYAITFDYGQRNSRELQAARVVARLAHVKSHEVLNIGNILKGRSPLINPNERLETYDDFNNMSKVIGDRIELTFVPMRNSLFLAIAANRAVCSDIYDVVFGICDASNTNYPDCTNSFIMWQEYCINIALGLYRQGMKRSFRLHAPLASMSKAQAIEISTTFPGCFKTLAYTYTAYNEEGYPPIGKDRASVLRAHGFEEAGLPDPLVVRACREGLMRYPNTSNYSIEALGRYGRLIRNE